MQRVILSGAVRRAVACSTTAVRRSLAGAAPTHPLGLARLRHAPAFTPLCAQLRHCSTASKGLSPTAGDVAATGDHAYPPEVEAQIAEWEERLKGLSPEDRELIISSLLHPEKQKASVMGGPGIGPSDADMVAAFTCGRCDFRMVKKFSKHAYTKGIVIVECPSCRGKHLLADNLGWLEDEAKNIEDILREKGEQFTRVGSGDYQVVNSAEKEAVKPE